MSIRSKTERRERIFSTCQLCVKLLNQVQLIKRIFLWKITEQQSSFNILISWAALGALVQRLRAMPEPMERYIIEIVTDNTNRKRNDCLYVRRIVQVPVLQPFVRLHAQSHCGIAVHKLQLRFAKKKKNYHEKIWKGCTIDSVSEVNKKILSLLDILII